MERARTSVRHRCRSPVAIHFAVAFGALTLSTACEPRLVIGTGCLMPSDCPSPLTCLAGRCRSACRDFRDCAYPLECVGVGDAAFGCRVGEDALCRDAADCSPPLACVRGECQQPCSAAAVCAPGLVCDPDRCAQPTPLTIAGACDPTAANSGCPSGQACVLSGLTFTCAAELGAADLGAACTAQTCSAGLTCAGERCVAVCRLPRAGCAGAACDDTSCGPNVYCGTTAIGIPSGDLPPTLPDGLGYCSERCNVYGDEANDDCPTGTACGLDNPRGVQYTWCRPLRASALLSLYSSCDADFGGCPRGTVCEVDAGDPARYCRPFCHPGTGAAECDIGGATGHTCVLIEELGIGVCGDV